MPSKQPLARGRDYPPTYYEVPGGPRGSRFSSTFRPPWSGGWFGGRHLHRGGLSPYMQEGLNNSGELNQERRRARFYARRNEPLTNPMNDMTNAFGRMRLGTDYPDNYAVDPDYPSDSEFSEEIWLPTSPPRPRDGRYGRDPWGLLPGRSYRDMYYVPEHTRQTPTLSCPNVTRSGRYGPPYRLHRGDLDSCLEEDTDDWSIIGEELASQYEDPPFGHYGTEHYSGPPRRRPGREFLGRGYRRPLVGR